MITTKNWLSDFLDLSSISTEKIAQKFNTIGHEVAKTQKLSLDENIVIGKIISKKKHENAEKLNVCLVDVGLKEPLQIVCGASNVQKDMFVAVSKIGAKLPNGLVIKPTDLRGVNSMGMICSAFELGLGEINKGILELDNSIGDLVLGKSLNAYPCFDDEIIEVELTPNRGDCLSVYGLARELSAGFELNLNTNLARGNFLQLGIGRVVSFKSSNVCSKNLFSVAKMTNFNLDLKSKIRLSLVEELETDNLRSLIKYVSLSTGVIMECFACKDLENKKVNIELDRKNGVDLCYINGELVSQTSIFNHKLADISATEVIFRASYTDPELVSKEVWSQKLKTDAMYYNSSRGSEPDLNFGISFLQGCNAGLEFYAQSIQNDFELTPKQILLNIKDASKQIGKKLDKNTCLKLLKLLGFDCSSQGDDSLLVKVPDFRQDIFTPADLIEEIVRMIGIDKIEPIPAVIKELSNLNASYLNYKFERDLAKKACSAGFSESINFVFAHKESLKSFGYEIVSSEKDIINPISSDLDTLRTSLVPNILKAIVLNKNKQKQSIALFELGDIFDKDTNQERSLCFIFSGNEFNTSIHSKQEKINFASFAKKISSVIGAFNLQNKQASLSLEQMGQTANVMQNEQIIGTMYKLSLQTQAQLNLDDTFVCELKLSALPRSIKTASEFSKFQANRRDLSLVIDKKYSFYEIQEAIKTAQIKHLQSFYPIDTFFDKSLKNSQVLTIRFIFSSLEKGLTESDIDIQKIVDLIKQKFNGELR